MPYKHGVYLGGAVNCNYCGIEIGNQDSDGYVLYYDNCAWWSAWHACFYCYALNQKEW